MANAYSPIRQYGDYIQPYNFDLLAKGLEYKQQKFDANVASIQQQIDRFAQVDILKPQDRQYFASRVNALVEGINRTSSMSSFDSSGVTRNIQNQIKNVFDQNVMNAVSSTANARKLQTEIADIKKNKLDQYATQNELYATRGLQQYLQDGQVGSVYNGGSYTPYYDIQKNLLPIMKDLHLYADVEKRTTPTGNGYYVTKSGKRISPEEVRRIAEGVLSAQANTQLQIDGWYNYGRGPNALANTRQNFEAFKNNSLAAFDTQIADLNVRLSSKANGAGARKEALQNALTALQSRREALRSTYDSWIASGDMDNMSFTLQKNRLMDGLGERYGFTQTEITYSTDQAFWNRQELAFKRWKALLESEDRRKAREAKGKKDKEGKKPIVSQVKETEDEGTIKPLKGAQETIESSTLGRNSLLNNKYNSLSADLRGDIDIQFENRRDRNQTKEDFLYQYFGERVKDTTSPGLMSIDEWENINRAHKTALINKKILNEEFDVAVAEERAEKLPQIFERVKDNPNVLIPVNGQGVPINEYLSSIGVTTYEDLEKNPEARAEIEKKLLGDKILRGGIVDEFTLRQFASQFGEGNEDIPEDVNVPVAGRQVMGGGGGFPGPKTDEEVISIRRGGIPANPKSMKKSMEYLRQARDINGRSEDRFVRPSTTDVVGAGGLPAPRFPDYGNLYDPDDIRTKMNVGLANRRKDLPQENFFLVVPGTPEHSELMNRVTGQAGNKFLPQKENTFVVELNPADPGSLIVRQKLKEGTVAGERNISVDKTVIPVENMPLSIMSKIDTDITKPLLTPDNFVEVERGGVTFLDQNNSVYLDQLESSVFRGDQGLLKISTVQGAVEELFTNYPDLLGGFYQNTTEVGNVIKRVLVDDRFAVTMKPTENKNAIRLAIQYDTGQDAQAVYTSPPLKGVDLDETSKLVDYAPQIVLYNMINSMLTDMRFNGRSVPNGPYNKLRQIYSQNGGR